MTKAQQYLADYRKGVLARLALVTFQIDEDAFHWAENSEEGNVAMIKTHLRTPEQKQWLFDQDLSIEDVLNGRITGEQMNYLHEIVFPDWNRKMAARYSVSETDHVDQKARITAMIKTKNCTTIEQLISQNACYPARSWFQSKYKRGVASPSAMLKAALNEDRFDWVEWYLEHFGSRKLLLAAIPQVEASFKKIIEKLYAKSPDKLKIFHEGLAHVKRGKTIHSLKDETLTDWSYSSTERSPDACLACALEYLGSVYEWKRKARWDHGCSGLLDMSDYMDKSLENGKTLHVRKMIDLLVTI